MSGTTVDVHYRTGCAQIMAKYMTTRLEKKLKKYLKAPFSKKASSMKDF